MSPRFDQQLSTSYQPRFDQQLSTAFLSALSSYQLRSLILGALTSTYQPARIF